MRRNFYGEWGGNPNMNHEEKIHSKQFRELFRHLNGPEKKVAAIFHVNQVAALATLAQEIEMLTTSPAGLDSLSGSLERQFLNRTLLVSFPKNVPNPVVAFGVIVRPAAMRPSAWSKVIYQPPFYVAFTPGLFEAVANELTMNASGDSLRRKSSLRFKI